LGNLNAKKFAMTRSTLRLAALSLALSSVALDASAQGLFGWLNRSDDTQSDAASDDASSSRTAQANRTQDSAPTELNSALAKAQISRKVGDFAEATKILSQLVLFAPDDPRVLGEYGKTLAAQGRSDDALAFLERAIQIRPGEWSFHSALGVAHDQKGEYPLAQAAYGRALQLKPGEAAVLNNAALSYMQSGDLDTAEQMIHQASLTTTDKPRIEYTMALVQRLKATRPAKPAVPTPATPVAPAAIPAPAPETPAPAPAAVASLAPAPAPETQAFVSPAPAEPIIETTPITSASLPPPDAEPVEWDVEVTPAAEEPAVDNSSTVLASLQANPSVVMQAVPKDDLAGPVQQRAEPKPQAPAQKPAVEAPPARRQLAVSANPPLTTRTPAEAAPAPAPKADAAIHAYYVQAGAFATEDRADKLAATLNMMGARVSPTTVNGRSLFRVRLGPYKDPQQANDALSMAKSMGHADVKVVTE
jgi:Flp pilus assembly protein TadD/cell division septation protein DedD